MLTIGCRRFGVLAICLITWFSAPAAFAQTLHDFNLPQQALADSLRAIGHQTSVNILFDPRSVEKLTAPAVHGQFSASQAVNRVLAGTNLGAEQTEANTLLVEPKDKPGKAQASATNDAPGDVRGDSQKEAGKKSSQDFRVAQVDQGAAGPQAVEAKREDKVKLEEIVVTGTHIRGVQPSSPVATISSEDIANSGYTNIGDVMRALPQNSAAGASPQTVTQSGPFGSAASNFAAGSAPNLRGLGPGSTLTLVNGHRLGQDSSSGAVDITQIPVDAIDRVEVVTDGASATYGSDAVAGVVNFILKKNYDGSQTSASYGTSTESGGRDLRVSELLGKSWATGSALVVYEHEKQDEVDASQRSFTSTVSTPYYLLPATKRDSGYVSVRQELFGNSEAYADGLYTSREADLVQTTFGSADFFPSPVRQYQATAGLNYAVSNTWRVGVVGSYASQKSTLEEFALPTQSPLYTEFNIGTTRTVEIDTDGHLLELPTGSVRMALGAGNRAESYTDRTPTGLTIADGSRRINYAFAELNLPLVAPSDRPWLMALNLDLGGRYEHYSDFGDKAIPKVGFVYVPSKQIKVRASASKSFRAPAISDVYGPYYASLNDLPDPLSKSPNGSPVIFVSGGRPTLQPETATSETVGLEVTPSIVDGLTVAPTYYHIAYTNRISSLGNANAALTDPANAPFITRNPSLALQQAIIAGAAGGFPNYSSGPYDPSTVAAFVDARSFNFGRQIVDGVDLQVTYTKSTGIGQIKGFFNGTYMDMWQQVTPVSPTVPLAGTSFNPPRVRARGGATWNLGPWLATATVNYLGHEVDTLDPGRAEVSSWTTVDAQVAYTIPKVGAIDGLRISVSVLNLFDRDPPFLNFVGSYRPGFNYDVVNATPMGRYVTIQAVVPVSW